MNDKVKIILWILLGMVLMFVILKLLSHRVVSPDDTWPQIKPIIMSQQFYNLTKTNEFRELAKMPEVSKMLETLANDQVTVLAQSLFNDAL